MLCHTGHKSVIMGKIYRSEAVAKDEFLSICVEESRFRDSDAFREEMEYFT